MRITESEILNASILIVDDLAFNISVLDRILKNAGYTAITSTTNPLEVSALQRKNRYDLILLDIEMPGMDGFQVMEGMKKAEKDTYPPVLVITTEPGHKLRAIECGAKDFISKPFELVDVITRVHNMLEAHLLEQKIEDHKEDNPALSNIIQRNIRKIIQIRLKSVRDQSLQDRIANIMTTFLGNMTFFYVHVIWFSVWFLLNTGHLGMSPFDPYPYGFLTMVVSLEAIFLATFLLISQNLLAKETERLTDLGLQTGLLTEHELTRALQMLRAIQNKMGISNNEDSNLADADLEMETRPEDVLAEIERLQKRGKRGPHQHQKLR